MNRLTLEKFQLLAYLSAIFLGLTAGSLFPESLTFLDTLLWPLLGLLLYATFTQVPLSHLKEALRDGRFLRVAVIGNFVILPIIIWAIMQTAPDHPAIRLGILLVLLVPCTDWFITFTQLGGGDTRHAIAFSPASLLLQMLLLPVYLWLFLDTEIAVDAARYEMLMAFIGLILTPLFLAYLTEKWVDADIKRANRLEQLAWFPIPLLTLVVFIISASQVGLVVASVNILGYLTLIFATFLLIAALLAYALARYYKLPVTQGRALAFSLGTRNSFVILPLALALPANYELTVVVIVFQSLVELVGMVVYLWWVPRILFKTTPA